jgi:hypothetical protein
MPTHKKDTLVFMRTKDKRIAKSVRLVLIVVPRMAYNSPRSWLFQDIGAQIPQATFFQIALSDLSDWTQKEKLLQRSAAAPELSV